MTKFNALPANKESNTRYDKKKLIRDQMAG